MQLRQLTLSSLIHLLTVAGVALMVAGGAMWWRQTRLEAALLAQESRVLLAVTANGQPGTLPDFDPAPRPVQRATATRLPSPTTTSEAAPADAVPAETRPEPTATPNPFPPAAAVPSRVVAPAIGLDAAVLEMGWEVRADPSGNPYSEWLVPDNAAGWHQNSLLPGNGGNTVLSGHHNTGGEVFRDVANLEPGDELTLEADGHLYRYRVEEKYIVKERGEPIEVRRENNRFIEPTPDERLTLVSCWPYETNTHRVIVIARPLLPDEPTVPATPVSTGE